MKTWAKALLGVTLSLMCLFTSVGYAKLSSLLIISGDAQLDPPEALFITDVSGGNYLDPDTLAFSGTVISSNLTLRQNSSGTYEANYSFTVFNNTDVSYYYLAMVHGTYTTEEGEVVAYSNPNIEMSVDITLGDEIKAGETRVINVTANFQKGSDTSDPKLFSIIDYQFSTTKPENKDEAAVSGVLGKFPEVLNDPEDYAALTSAMDTTGGLLSGGRLSDTYIGNVVGDSNGNDTKALNDLFGEAMKLNIDGTDTPITVIIKRKDVDNDNSTGDEDGREMILYITADPLNTSGKYVPVYVVVYTKTASTDWYQIGEVYKGTANVRQYGGLFDRGTGSFNTENWLRVDEEGNRISGDTVEKIIQNLKS